MQDPMDIVRALFRAMNAGDAAAMAELYDGDCRVEHIFVDDDGVHGGTGAVLTRWRHELAKYEGALAGGARIAVSRIAGIETGWGWVRAEWASAIRRAGSEDVQAWAGYSHFWIEDGRIRRHRTVRRPLAHLPDAALPAATSDRQFPSRPIVGVGAVIVTDDRKVVLVKRTREPLANQWSLPGGTVELGENLEAAAAREVLEETGLVVEVGPVVEVFDRILVDDDQRVRYHFVLVDYLCRPRGGTLAAGSDVADAVFADPDALGPYHLADKARDVIARALGNGGR
jgi:8-oxo-dGTP diphosphatase